MQDRFEKYFDFKVDPETVMKNTHILMTKAFNKGMDVAVEILSKGSREAISGKKEDIKLIDKAKIIDELIGEFLKEKFGG